MVLGREGLSVPCVRPTHNVEGFSCTQWEKQGNARAVHLLGSRRGSIFLLSRSGTEPSNLHFKHTPSKTIWLHSSLIIFH